MIDIGTFARWCPHQDILANFLHHPKVPSVEVVPMLAQGVEPPQVPEREASAPGEALHQLPRPAQDLLRDTRRALRHLGHGDD